MSTLGIAAFAGVFYYNGWYAGAFWILLLGIVNGVLGGLRAFVDPRWYTSQAAEAGVEPNYGMLLFAKGIALAILVPMAWHVGVLAGYL